MKKNFRQAVFVLTTIVILSLIHLFIYTQNITLKYRSVELKTKLAQLRSQNRELGYRVAKRENLWALEKITRGQLNMLYPEKLNYILSAPAAKISP